MNAKGVERVTGPSLGAYDAFVENLTPLRGVEWVVYSKRPFGGPEAVLAYLSRCTHRVAISNSRLPACDGAGVAFKYKDYRVDGHARQRAMRLATGEFIRRVLIHVLPTGFHRIRHYGLFASGVRAHNIAHARELRSARLFARRNQDRHVMIEIASPATPQLSSLLPPRRRRSSTLANAAAAKNMIPLPPENTPSLRSILRNHL